MQHGQSAEFVPGLTPFSPSLYLSSHALRVKHSQKHPQKHPKKGVRAPSGST